MKRILNLLLTLVVMALLTVSGIGAQSGRGPAGDSASRGDSNSPENLRAAVAEQGALSLIVVLNVEQAGRQPFAQLSDDAQRETIAQIQEAVLGELGLGVFSTDSARAAAHVTRYTNFPLLALSTDSDQLETLLASGHVAAIQRDAFRAPSLLQTTSIIGMTGANGAWAKGADGEGQTVAILDSGIQSNHPQLPLKIVSEACYGVTTSGTYNNTNFTSSPSCPGGVNSTALGSGIPCVFNSQNIANKNQCDHGTNVAGVVAAKTDASINGVAKEATLISIQVFSMISTPSAATGQGCDNNATPGTVENQCILAADSSIIAAMDRVYDLRTSFNIPAVNMSLGSEIYSSQAACDAALPAYVTAVNKLTGVGIAVVASSGNEGRTDGINAPACITGMISVGATNDNDTIYLQSNAAPFLSYMAPGSFVDTTDTESAGDNVSGTSFSAPHVAGAIAALRSYNPNASLTLIKTALTNTGVNITETVNGQLRTYKRIQVDAAVDGLIVPDKPNLLAPDNNAFFNTSTITFEWSTGANTDLYRLFIYRPDNSRIVEQDILHADCDLPNNKCSVAVTAAFVDGTTYRWDVNARKGNTGTRSDQRTFVYDVPGKPEIISPDNGAEFNTPSAISLTWVENPDADTYTLKIKDTTTGKTVITQALDVSARGLACASGTCTFTPDPAQYSKFIDKHVYQWWVVVANELGTSVSEKRTFKAQFPAAPVLVSPIGGALVYDPSTLQLVWSAVSDASTYKLNVTNVSTGKSVLKKTFTPGVDLTCTVTECAYTLSPTESAAFKSNKSYKWGVIALNAFGTTPSAKATFKTQFPGKPTLMMPVNNIKFTDKTQLINFMWTPAPGATTQSVTYRLRVFLSTNPDNRILDVVLTPGVDVLCDASTCTYTVTTTTQDALKFGKDYKWWVQALAATGKSKSATSLFKLRQN